MNELIDLEEFNSIDIRIGSILKAYKFMEAKKPAYKLVIDFGRLGILNSSAQITDLYTPKELTGRDVVVVINIGKRKIHDFISECLVLGVSTKSGVSLLKPGENDLKGCLII